jgi:F-type H+-transporting ATPase subunit b
MPSFLVELFQDAHFWVGVAFAILVLVLLRAGVPGLLAKALDSRAGAVQAQLDEATRLRNEAQALLADIKVQRETSETQAAEMLANAAEEAKRLEAEAKVNLADQIRRRGELAERKIASAEAQAAADVKAAAAEFAAQLAEQVLASRIATAKTDPLIDRGIDQLAAKLQ